MQRIGIIVITLVVAAVCLGLQPCSAQEHTALTTALQTSPLAPAVLPQAPELAWPAPDAPNTLFVASDPQIIAEYEPRGYDFYNSISQAINAAKPGGVVFVTAGEYFENLELYALKGLTIVGQEGALLIAENDSDCVNITSCEGIRIRNLDVIHAIGENPCYHNCYVISDGQDILIDYCDISGCGYTGVAAYGWEGSMQEVRIEYCTIHDCQIAIEDYSYGGLLLEGNAIWACPEEMIAPDTEAYESEWNEPPAEPEVPDVKPEQVPQPPLAVLPPALTPNLIVVAQDTDRRKELNRNTYWCVPTIQRALDAAENGFTIFITKGTYYENIRLIGLRDITLQGEEGVLVVADNDVEVCFIQECDNIRIHNVDVVHQIGIEPCLHNCFVIWDAQDVLIEFCDISGCGYIGVEVLGNGAPESVIVQHCTIHDCQVAYYDVVGDALKVFNNALWNIQIISWTL